MNKRLLLTFFIVLSVLLSVSAVCASDINVIDSSVDSVDISVSSDSCVGNDSSKVSLSSDEVLESGNSNTLSTNTDSSELTAGAVSTKLITPSRTVNVNDAVGGFDYQVILRDVNGKPLAGKEVSFNFNGVDSTGFTDSNGCAATRLTVNSAGTYDVKVTFSGDAGYKGVSQIGSIKIIKSKVNILAPDRTLFVENISGGYSYSVFLRDSDGNALSKKQVSLTFNGKTQVLTTNSGGACYFNISADKAGNYSVEIKFAGDRYCYSSSTFRTVEVIKEYVKLLAPDRTLYLDDISGGYSYSVFLRDSDGNALANKKISLTFNGEVLNGTTNSRGACYFNISVDKAGSYSVVSRFAGDRYYHSNSTFRTVEVVVMKNVTFLAPDRTLYVDEISGGYSYPVYLRDSDGNVLANKKITLIFNGKKFTGVTNSRGVCYFNISVSKAGNYSVGLEFAGDKYYYPNSSPDFRTVKVIKYGVRLTWKSGTSFASDSQTFKVLLTDSNGVALAGKVVKLTINSKTYSEKTDKNGYATFNLNLNLDPKSYTVSYTYDGDNLYNSNTGTTKIKITGSSSVSINDILTASVTVKNYYSENNKLPTTVTIAGYDFTMPEFLYLMSQAIYQLGNSNNTAVSCIYGVKKPSSPSGDNINDRLYKAGYLEVAKNVADYIKSNNQAPNYASSTVGKIYYTEVVDAFSRILAFYKNNDEYMPNYVSIYYGSSSYTGPVNVINTIKNLTPYYQATKNCEVNNTAIKNVVDSLISGLTTAEEKAIAIYNYVRDQVSYSFYYDTYYGAVGTLNAKTGNCVDQAHLLIAMYRTAGLAARYEHGTCYFTLSGSTYGHVWAQVLLDDVWVVADPTSNRNSFGNVVNWNTYSYTHNGYYASLPF